MQWCYEFFSVASKTILRAKWVLLSYQYSRKQCNVMLWIMFLKKKYNCVTLPQFLKKYWPNHSIWRKKWVLEKWTLCFSHWLFFQFFLNQVRNSETIHIPTYVNLGRSITVLKISIAINFQCLGMDKNFWTSWGMF